MKKYTKFQQNEDINLVEIFKTIWSEKILIISFSFIFMITGYVYGTLQTKIYKAEVIFAPLSFSFLEKTPIDVNRINDKFVHNLSSVFSIIKFVESNDKISDLKSDLKKNVSVKNYFFDQKQSVEIDDKKKKNKYYLTYSQYDFGETFFYDYFLYVYQETIEEIKQESIKEINIKIAAKKENIEIAKKIGLEKPYNMMISPFPDYAHGSIVLLENLNNLNKKLSEIKNFSPVNSNLIEKITIINSKHKPVNIVIGLLFGLFFSSIAIYFKTLFKKL
jgi:hypothetical protein